MLPPQPILSPTMDSPTVSPLSLPGSPPSPTLSRLSLDDGASLWTHDDDSDDASSTADTADSCTSASCCPPPTVEDDHVKPLPTSLPAAADPPAAAAPSHPISIPESSFSPLLIIGAGPHALALAARLSEPRPAALYSDLEHARLAWLQREDRGRQRRRKSVKGHWAARKLVEPATATLAGAGPGRGPDSAAPPAPSAPSSAIQVLDSSSSTWLGRWDSFFSGLSIEHLRSPMLFHPAPADANALVAFAQREGREDELLPIKGVVGAEQSKHMRKKRPQRVGRAPMINEREREDYHRPSSALFRSFIESDLVDRYSLTPPAPPSPPLVAHTTVTAVSYEVVHVPGREPEQAFVVRSRRSDGTEEVRGARAVVLAIGPSCTPVVSCVIKEAVAASRSGRGQAQEQEQRSASEGPSAGPWSMEAVCGEGWCHSTAFAMPGCAPMDGPLGERVRQGKPTRVVVLGGGLTSAQIVDSLIEAGVSHVTLLSRSHIKVSAFDFPLTWVSKYANLEKMAFYSETDPLARHDLIRQARNGGSVNAHFYGVLKRHVKSGRLDLRTLTEVESAHLGDGGGGGKWTLEARTRLEDKAHLAVPGAPLSRLDTLADVDHVVCATGSALDLAGVECVRPLLASHPVELVRGLPRLTSDLQWREDVPFFVAGAYAMLELGPDALNLSGTRPGAERIAHRLGALGIFDDVPGGGVHAVPRRSSPASTAAQQDGAGRAGLARKEHRSGGEGNFFDGLEVEELSGA
ncbi:hypothetical protein JCM8208_000152 [Rhodotorula glutinis]